MTSLTKLNKVLCQAMRIITGYIKSTPISSLLFNKKGLQYRRKLLTNFGKNRTVVFHQNSNLGYLIHWLMFCFNLNNIQMKSWDDGNAVRNPYRTGLGFEILDLHGYYIEICELFPCYNFSYEYQMSPS